MTKIKALGLCGSLRGDSYNLKLLKNFLAVLDAGPLFSTTLHGALDLPLFNQDAEKPPFAPRIEALQAAIREAPVIVIASPEYNGSMSGALKNAVDWATRPAGQNLWQGKIVALLAASPGQLGGVRGLIHVRAILSGLKAWVIPEQVQCGVAHEAFDASGTLKAEVVQKQGAAAAQSLEIFAKKLLS